MEGTLSINARIGVGRRDMDMTILFIVREPYLKLVKKYPRPVKTTYSWKHQNLVS